jgi:hypothetical protein
MSRINLGSAMGVRSMTLLELFREQGWRSELGR